jgi:hypothetical protein
MVFVLAYQTIKFLYEQIMVFVLAYQTIKLTAMESVELDFYCCHTY